MDDRVRENFLSRLMPRPREIEIPDGELLLLSENSFTFHGPDDAAARKCATEWLQRWWNVSGAVFHATDAVSSTLPSEGYRIETRPGEIAVSFSDGAGLRHALRTLRQLAEPCRGTRTISGWQIPPLKIADEPAMGFRGVHLCVFPETEKLELVKQIHLAAYLKLNYVLLESWGTFPFVSEPDFSWPETAYTQEDFRELVEAGRSLGVAVCPAVNLVGHATWATGGKSGKFAVLDFHPEYAPLFEPDGWCWCFSNPETRRVLKHLIDEMCDVFDNPPFFHVGCDEADSMMSCSSCAAREPLGLLRDHLCFLREALAPHGCRMMIWHDMLVDRNDPRWAGFTAFGHAELRTPELYRELPRDVVICDWEYDRPCPTRDYEIAKFFKENGFMSILCSCEDKVATAKMGRSIRDNRLDGLLGTTWLRCVGRDFGRIYTALAHASWNPGFAYAPDTDDMAVFNTHLRYVDQDIGVKRYEEFGRLVKYQQDPVKLVSM